MGTTEATGIISTLVSDIGGILTTGITILLGIVGVLIGLFFVMRLLTIYLMGRYRRKIGL